MDARAVHEGGRREGRAAYDLSADELATKAGVPFCIIHGDDDAVVPLEASALVNTHRGRGCDPRGRLSASVVPTSHQRGSVLSTEKEWSETRKLRCKNGIHSIKLSTKTSFPRDIVKSCVPGF